jgi:hypothetical protein
MVQWVVRTVNLVRLGFLVIAGFVFLLPVSQLLAVSRNVFLVLDLTDDVSVIGNRDDFEKNFIKIVREKAPQQEFAVIRAGTPDDLKRQLLSFSDREIDGIYFIDHGFDSRWMSEQGGLEVVPTLDSVATLSNESQVGAAAKEVFAPIIGHFSAGARLVFIGCHMIHDGNDDARFRGMKSVAELFQLRDGTIYMNRTLGSTTYELFRTQPFWDQPGFLRKAEFFVNQVMFPGIDSLLFYTKDRVLMNRGDTLAVDPVHGYRLFQDDLFSAEKRAVSETIDKKPLMITPILTPSGDKSAKSSSGTAN